MAPSTVQSTRRCSPEDPDSYRTEVTLVGWLLILGGLARILFPKQLASFAAGVKPTPILIVALVVLLLGLFLAFHGYRRRAIL
jgi:hypothetical protein